MKSTGFVFALAAMLGLPSLAPAQTYPQRSVRVVVSFPPGGSTDFIARMLAQHLPAALGQSFVVDNRGGAAGTIGTDIVAKAAPDGYTLLFASSSTFATAPGLTPNLPLAALRHRCLW